MDTVPFLLCELGAPLFTNLKGAGTYFMCIPAMNRRMYKTLVDITSAGVFVAMYQEETAGGRFCRLLKNVCTDNRKHIRSERRNCFGNNQRRRKNAAGKTIYAYLSEEGYDTSRVVVEQNLQIIPPGSA